MRNPALSLVAATGFAAPALAGGDWNGDRDFAAPQVPNREATSQMARAAMTACRYEGYQIGVTVVDRFIPRRGLPRDRVAGTHVYETSQPIARTAIRYRTCTGALAESSKAGSAPSDLRTLTNALPPAGGLMVTQGPVAGVAGVAGIGLSGAPEPVPDGISAQAGKPSTGAGTSALTL